MLRLASVLFCIVLVLAGVTSVVRGQEVAVALGADRDNTLYQDTLGQLSNGAGQYMFAGFTSRGFGERRALVRFNVAGAVPAGATIVSAELRLNCSRNNSIAGSVALHRVLENWGEGASDAGNPGGAGVQALAGDATWLHAFYPGTLWSAVGGVFSPAASASTIVPQGFDGVGPRTWPSTAGTVADVQAWLDQPASNFGWIIVGADGDGSTARRFDTRTNAIATTRPQLSIVYRTVQPGACCVSPSCTLVNSASACSGRFVGPNTACNAVGNGVTPCCRADFNNSGTRDVQDIFAFLAAWFGNAPGSDFNGVNGRDVQDIFDYLAAWFAGC